MSRTIILSYIAFGVGVWNAVSCEKAQTVLSLAVELQQFSCPAVVFVCPTVKGVRARVSGRMNELQRLEEAWCVWVVSQAQVSRCVSILPIATD